MRKLVWWIQSGEPSRLNEPRNFREEIGGTSSHFGNIISSWNQSKKNVWSRDQKTLFILFFSLLYYFCHFAFFLSFHSEWGDESWILEGNFLHLCAHNHTTSLLPQTLFLKRDIPLTPTLYCPSFIHTYSIKNQGRMRTYTNTPASEVGLFRPSKLSFQWTPITVIPIYFPSFFRIFFHTLQRIRYQLHCQGAIYTREIQTWENDTAINN